MTIGNEYGRQINIHPIDLSLVLPATGGIPLPKRSQQRKDYRMQELRRWRDYLNLPLNCEPKHFPVSDESAAAMVIAIREENPEAALLFAGLCLEGVWANDLDISDTSILLRLAEELDIDGEAALSKQESMLAVRESESKLAISKGVYGAPTYVVNGEIFWGQDRLDFLERFVAA